MIRLLLLLLYLSASHAARDRLQSAVLVADSKYVQDLLHEKESGIITSHLQIDVNRVESVNGRTSLLQCGFDPQKKSVDEVDMNCTDIARQLYSAGANMSHVDNHGWNAVAIGAMKGFTEYCRFLIGVGVPVNSIDANGRTPLMKAVTHGHLKTVRMLLGAGADISIKDRYGWSALHFATRQLGGHSMYKDVLAELCEAVKGGSILNVQDADGRTPLMYAALQKTVHAAELLLAAGADPRVVDNGGSTAYQLTDDEVLRKMLAKVSATLVEAEYEKFMRRRSKRIAKMNNQCPINGI
mmetsp:Transcript_24461/g.35962  ORF Transcript_24461/g.35962 Transcript_24461/m.35962 type:complete len:297 (-) Transcript_24461:133-1023(-)|eukprot:CAMPEP_0185033062 /NCGR_PEP_ID=MMETSP1103-20130426/21694_1 /TAXON_ID=36769 /ORGANISM="Paraphysomonas bandaiensis, Strain Caron Lab Isolate" /LENGTH=296 /DNA_ID=CAMNT_0027569199 /DNA_START=59 /DNA_END=949 /DNA_ORIENTATION=-